MAALRHISRNFFTKLLIPESRINIETCAACVRFLNYSSIEYEEKHDPTPKFFNNEIQSLLRNLTRIDLARVNRKRKLGAKRLTDPEYKFMTDEELKEAQEISLKKTEEILQIPPAVPLRKPVYQILSRDHALLGLEESKMVFTDITFGVKDSERLIVVREQDGTLRNAEWDLRNRMNQLYFPKEGRMLKPSRMFFGEYFDSLLQRKEYEFILDMACSQFEPNDPDYQRVVTITYQHLNDHNGFESVRSTRHFGALTFFLAWHKIIDNLLLELIETFHIEEVNTLLELFSKLHGVDFEKSDNVERIDEYIKKFSSKKAALELALQAYKDVSRQRKELEQGIKIAHGLN